MKDLQDCYILKNGVKMPCVGYGTYKTHEEETYRAVRAAIDIGYRHIDTASLYGNEAAVGRAVRDCGLPREELFVTSKLWNDDQGYESTLAAFARTLEQLGMDYVDLYLIHWPIPEGREGDWQTLNQESWRAMEELYRAGKIRALGVSNFLPHHLQSLMDTAQVPVMVDQLEIHPMRHQREAVNFCQRNGIQVEAWAPLVRGRAFDDPVLRSLAEKYQKTVPQICLRWSMQQGIVPLPKSSHEGRIRENADIFDFALAPEDMAKLLSLDGELGVGRHPDHFGEKK
ncbi:aldo/keto reductase [Bittarella sp. HCP28S3_D9]|uniref:aldo/keto reductase n=1 Tax=Bittarella sp. HCP28S3_D9 TaxID=3440253 RepID=UPI003F890224